MSLLTREELERYSRHLVLEQIGIEGQQKIKKAKVLVIGAGGLGSPVVLYLAAAGVGTIGVVDHDTVQISNLQRQIIFNMKDIGLNKAHAACQKINALNPLVHAIPFALKITAENAIEIIAAFDILIDCTDNFPTRYLLNDVAVLTSKPLVYGSILKFEGHVSVLNHELATGFSSTYRDLFPEPPSPESVQNCEQAGVLGVLPGIIGTLQANEVLKIITGTGDVLANKLLILDSLTLEQTIITIPDRGARSRVKHLVDYEDFCGISPDKNKSLAQNKNSTMKEITVQELKKLKDTKADFQLIDVREPHEYDICNIEGELIPMSEIPYNVEKIARDKQVVIHCRSGKRSGDMLLWLEKNHGFENLYNLKGGILAWSKEIDPSMPQY